MQVRSRIGTAVRTGVQNGAEGERECSTSDRSECFEGIAVDQCMAIARGTTWLSASLQPSLSDGSRLVGTHLANALTTLYESPTVRPEMAQSVSRSSVSRESVQASAELLKSLREKLWDTLEILAPRPLPASLEPASVD